MSILNEIGFEYYPSRNQKNLFTPCHKRWECVIRNNNHTELFDFQCNEKREPTLEEVLECIISDIDGYNMSEDFIEFCKDFGYTTIEQYAEARVAYEGCRLNSIKLLKLFSPEQIEDIRICLNYL